MGWYLLLVWSLIFLNPQPDTSFQGRVIAESGTPIQGASVLLVRTGAPDAEVGILTSTDETGTFRFKKTPDAVFVQKAGFEPMLYRTGGIIQSPLFVMKPVSIADKRELAMCPWDYRRLPPAGFNNRIAVPENLHVKTSNYMDAAVTEISYSHNGKSEIMTLSWGLVANLGYPRIATLARTNAITFNPPLDIQGTTANGRHWRWMYLANTHIEYYDASPEAAELFDTALSSFCRESDK